MASNKIRVIIADDHRLFREMLRITLSEEEDIELVGEAGDGLEAVELTRKHRPDIVLMDISMPRMDGISATKMIKEEVPSTKIVVLTAKDDDDYVFTLVQAGATGYLLKDTSTDRVISAIRSAHSGESLIQPSIASKILREFIRMKDEKKQEPPRDNIKKLEVLTNREMEVVALVGQGLNNREIAEKLYIGENTVKTHVANSIHKLGLRDRIELVLLSVQSGVMNK